MIRFSVAPFTEQRWDMYIWRLHQIFVYVYHINPFWSQIQGVPDVFYWSYPPLWLFTLVVIYPFYALFSVTQYPANLEALWETWKTPYNNMFEAYWSFTPPRVGVNLPLLDLLIKTPIIFADLLIAVVLFRMAKSFSNNEKSIYVYCAWLFNPFTIFISSIWGAFDAIPSLLTLLSVNEIIHEKHTRSAILLSIAIMYKLYPIVLVPIFALICYKYSRKLWEMVKYIAVSLGLFIALTFTTYFISAQIVGQNAIELSIKLITFLLLKRASPDMYGQNIISGLTPLVVLQGWLKDFRNIPITPILLGTGIVIIMIKIMKTQKFSDEKTISFAVIAHFAIYLTYTVVNPQYFIWVLPLLILLSILNRSQFINQLYWLMSGIGILYILQIYDLSYHISPYMLPENVGYLKIFVPGIIIPAMVAAAIGLVGLKFAVKRHKVKKRTVA